MYQIVILLNQTIPQAYCPFLPTYLPNYITYICSIHLNLRNSVMYLSSQPFTKYTYITSIGYYLQLCYSLLQAVNQQPTLSKQHKNTLGKGKVNLCTGLDGTG